KTYFLHRVFDGDDSPLDLIDQRPGFVNQWFSFGLKRSPNPGELLDCAIDKQKHRRLHEKAYGDDCRSHRHDDVELLLIHEPSALHTRGCAPNDPAGRQREVADLAISLQAHSGRKANLDSSSER